ncbi:hypothetical protein [Burkholderia sp. Ac-20379]|uniref:hypothetical protein n=1 Tax=Burkholderia sp. Ac-20379 TaxID=2703900 RepID=UPI001F11A0E2|nr:hypothetical protein [Burkholderia sp. Ac-20379]
MAAGAAAHALPLTAAQCARYPFAAPRAMRTQALTRHDVTGELAELEAVGFSPAQVNGSDFPDDVRAARRKLAREYRRDCGGTQATNSSARASSQLR